MNFVAAEVGPSPGHEDSAMLLRGDPKDTRFTLEQAPDSAMSAVGLARYTEVVHRASARYRDVSLHDI